MERKAGEVRVRNRKRKEYRELTVGEAFFCGNRSVPQLRIQGLWLLDLGFQVGDSVKVKCEDERIIITPDDMKNIKKCNV